MLLTCDGVYPLEYRYQSVVQCCKICVMPAHLDQEFRCIHRRLVSRLALKVELGGSICFIPDFFHTWFAFYKEHSGLLRYKCMLVKPFMSTCPL